MIILLLLFLGSIWNVERFDRVEVPMVIGLFVVIFAIMRVKLTPLLFFETRARAHYNDKLINR